MDRPFPPGKKQRQVTQDCGLPTLIFLQPHPHPRTQGVPSYPGMWLREGEMAFYLDQLVFSPFPALAHEVTDGPSG